MKRAVRPKDPQAVDRHLAARIHEKRIELGMSQEVLGRALGVRFQQFQKYEKGSNRLSAGRLFEIANLFDVEVSYFFEGLPRRTSNAARVFHETICRPWPPRNVRSFLIAIALSVPKTKFGRIGDAVHRGQDMILGRQGAKSDDAPARLC